ncbi:3-oxoacyl-ACP reductase [Sulfurifustis variabilis]|uniref:3-oxoacyl-ACP reductase n=1 Tax=Sulfurifustis variabilis TaxID=1675686 RepID=A0A1B4V529_9GAMM|nr:YciK family oxidoreductase [Sulfurifustis variabilis]BAU48638.1 3-oxoacyl-ACP reductase [Sulfurifustis variabilis]
MPYTPAPDSLAGRVLLVSGASGGLGRAASLALAEHGATVVLLGRTLKKLERVYDEIEAHGGPKPAMLVADLASAGPTEYQTVAQTIAQEFGRLDGLLHSAAELGTLTPLELYDLQTWQRVLAVNLTAPFLLTRACLPLLKRSDDASVVFTSADVGRRARAYWGAYAVAAFGLEGMAQILADELAENTRIRVNTLDPGPVRTDLRAAAYPGESPLATPAPEAVMATYLYLLGPDSRGVTGQALTAERAM